MIARLTGLVLGRRALVVSAALLLAALGLWAFRDLDIEAYPDPVQPRVEVTTQVPGWSAEEVERLVTRPLEWGLAGIRGLEAVRTDSIFGLSDVKLYFGWDSDYYWDRTETLNRLALIGLPPGVSAELNPDNPIGEVYRYTVESADHDLYKEKEAEDWVLERQLKTVPGVQDVSSFGGLTKEYHVDVDPGRLVHYGASLGGLASAVANANANVGGGYLKVGDQALDVRGAGFIQGLDDIRDVTLGAARGTPVRVRDVAEVSVGHAPRLGVVGRDQRDDVVEGVVLMRKYGDTLATLAGVKAKLAEIAASGQLPPGVKVSCAYDRAGLVRTTVRTVLENLALGMGLVFLVLLFFLGDLRAAAIAALNIPLAMLGAFALLRLSGTPANLLSLGAVDFGIIIDSTIIVVENVFRRLAAAREGPDSEAGLIGRAMEEVGGPMLSSTVIFILAFLPLFTMRGVEGVIFAPMSRTYAFALAVAILLAATLTPALCSLWLEKGLREAPNPAWEAMQRAYRALFARVLARPRLTLAVLAAVVAGGLALAPFLGGEFLPALEEGNVWVRATLPMTVSLSHADDVARRIRRTLLSYPEAGTVISQVGRPDDASDVAGFYNLEFYMELKPRSAWPRGLTKDALVADVDARLEKAFPEAAFGFSQNIEDNVEEALSGVMGENVVKAYGPDLADDERAADAVNRVLARVRGVEDNAVYRALGQPDLLVTPDRARCARYGLNVGDVNAVVQAAVGGQTVTQVLEGRRQFALVVRWKESARQNADAIGRIRVSLPAGGSVPLAQVAAVTVAPGASFIYREGLRRYVPVRFSVRGRDMASAVAEARARVAREARLPAGVTLDWAGEVGELKAADRRLAAAVPLALLLITGVLYWATASWVNTLILMAQVPVAALGGVLALAVTRTPFSVSAAVGFISIFAISIMDGLLLNSYIHRLFDQGRPLVEAIVEAADRRFRAVMMTALVDGLGLLPMALSTRIGAQAQRPLAIVVIGGSLSIALLTRLLHPTLVYVFHRQVGLSEERRRAREADA